MTIWTRAVAAAALVSLAGCGAATSNPATSNPATSNPATPSPATDLGHASLLDTSWISATDGWALAVQPCAKRTCTRLARTTDGGRHWQLLPDPPARVQDGTINCSAHACVSEVSFATSSIGYLYGPALLMTTDGGRSWHAEPGRQTEALTVAGGQVYRIAFTEYGCPGPCDPSLVTAPTGSASWRTLIGRLATPGRSGSAQIGVSGPDVLVAMYGSQAAPIPAQAVLYRSVDSGGNWQQVTDPCGKPNFQHPNQEKDLIGLAAAPGGFFAGLCIPRLTSRTFVITSTDAGATWQPTAASPRGHWLGLLAAADPATIAVTTGAMGGSGTSTSQLLVTTDRGKHWVTAATDTHALTTISAPAWLGFETPLAGQWLSGPHGIWTTTDGGRHWTRIEFG